MITIQIIGDRELVTRFDLMPKKLHDRLLTKITGLAAQLERHVKRDKLQGQVLHKITGRLAGSIQHSVDDSGTSIVGKVYSASTCNYAAIHEYGGKVRTRLGTGKIKSKVGGKAYAVMPERSFLRSSLDDYRQKIIDGLTKTAKQVAGEK